jgi:biopolymer transport protein ExbD
MPIKRGSKISASFSAASMTDLMFLLLVFMLVAMTLVTPNALRLVLPQSNNQIRERPYAVVSITPDIKFYVDGDQVEEADLAGVLRTRLAGVENPTIALRADKPVAIDHVVKVMNIAIDNRFAMILHTAPR